MKIQLDNYSRWNDQDIRKTVASIAKDLKLKRGIRFIFQTTWTEITDAGEIVPGTEQDIGFDGDAYDTGVVRVCLGTSQEFPFVWNINPALKGFYLRHIIEFKNKDEAFLYFASHELRHLWQWEHPEKARLIRRLLKCDDETDADIYAMMNLSRYRNR